MKKNLLMLAIALVLLMPFGVHAETKIDSISCTDPVDDVKTCTVKVSATSEISSVTVSLTEKGGAEIVDDSITALSYWTPSISPQGSGVYNLKFDYNYPENFTGSGDLFTFKYKISGQTDCEIVLQLDGVSYSEKPAETPKPVGKCTKEDGKYFINGEEVTKEQYNNECSKTGSSVPYIALVVMSLAAGGAYLATKNKTKMYRI